MARPRSDSGHSLDTSTLPGQKFNAAYTDTVWALVGLEEVSEVDSGLASRFRGNKEKPPEVSLEPQRWLIRVRLYSISDRSRQDLLVYIKREVDWEKGVHAVCRVLGVSGKPLLADTDPPA